MYNNVLTLLLYEYACDMIKIINILETTRLSTLRNTVRKTGVLFNGDIRKEIKVQNIND